MTSEKIATVERAGCVACGYCENICPSKAITIRKGLYAAVDPAACQGCGVCARNCSAGVIVMGARKEA